MSAYSIIKSALANIASNDGTATEFAAIRAAVRTSVDAAVAPLTSDDINAPAVIAAKDVRWTQVIAAIQGEPVGEYADIDAATAAWVAATPDVIETPRVRLRRAAVAIAVQIADLAKPEPESVDEDGEDEDGEDE